jgi:lipoprotein NlpD
MQGMSRARIVIAMLAGVVAVGCTTRPHRAPVEDRMAAPKPVAVAVATPVTGTPTVEATVVPLPGAENAGKAGYYMVKPGDTLNRIAAENGQNPRDLIRWNGLENPNVIEVGQVLRVVPPGTDPALAQTRPVTPARVETRPLTASSAPVTTGTTPTPIVPTVSNPTATIPSAAPTPTSPPVAAAASAATPQTANASPPQAPRDGDEDVRWAWPAAGAVKASFDDAKVKGLVLSGKAGDPVLAAADGRVVYAGSGLRGYGNLVILKHNTTYLTAYAHNQTLLVKEDQNVKRGQKIAEMGSTDADSVQLHFEIRRQGKPIDPAKLLPPR